MVTREDVPTHDLGSLRIHEGQRKGGKVGKGLAIFFGLLIVLSGVGAGVYALLESKPAVEVAVARKAVGAGNREALLNATGYVTPRQRATIAAKITGRVTGVFFDEGTHVHQGQIAVHSGRCRRQKSSGDGQGRPRFRQSRPRRLRSTAKECSNLAAPDRGTPKSWGRAPGATGQCAHRCGKSPGQNRSSQGTSDCGGRRHRRLERRASRRDGFPLSAGGGFTRTGIATIVDMNSNEIEVDVNEAYITRVKPGQQVTAILDAYPDWEIPSRVRTIIPSADRQKATVKVRISFLKLDPRILPDMGIKVTFLGDEPSERNVAAAPAILIPQNAVRDDGGKKVVFLIKADKTERRAVTLGGNRGTDVE